MDAVRTCIDAAQTPEETIVLQFNRSITAADLDGLAALMAEEHTFVDSADRRLVGKAVCLEAWHQFFRRFPGSRNIYACKPPPDRDWRLVGLAAGTLDCLDVIETRRYDA